MKNWTFPGPVAPEADAALAPYQELVRRLLFFRGVSTAEEAERFLSPSYDRDLHDPFLMAGMERAVERILRAMAEGEKLVIFGDYDTDGVPGTALLSLFFDKVGHSAYSAYIPDRHTEGFGLTMEAVEKFAAEGVKVVVTIDCGITDVAQVARANELGLDVIVTDHHLAHGELPPAYAIVDSKQDGCEYPYKMLCGCAVAFKLVQGLIARGNFGLVPGWEKWLLDLVAISTVSDMVPLDGENRTLAYYGLKVLRKTRRIGIGALCAAAGAKLSVLCEDDIGFTLGPRLNTASRMSDVYQAYSLLRTADPVEAQTIAKHLEEKNKERRKTVDVILRAVDAEFSGGELPPVMVCGADGWSLGVLGLTASRVVEKYGRTVFLWGVNGKGVVKGSCRTDGSVNLVELMERAGGNGLFLNYGGHVQAGGFSVASGREAELKERLLAAYESMEKAEVVEEIRIDGELELDDVTERTHAEIDRLAPFGIGNPKPVFLFRGVRIAAARGFGNGGIHLELVFEKSGGAKVPAIGFFSCSAGEAFDAVNGHRFHGAVLEPGEKVDLLASLEKSYFRNRPELRLRIVDIRPLGVA